MPDVRRCPCGTVLSLYNDKPRCAVCQEKAPASTAGRRKYSPDRQVAGFFANVRTRTLTIENGASDLLETMCQADDSNRSRFITHLIYEEAKRRGL